MTSSTVLRNATRGARIGGFWVGLFYAIFGVLLYLPGSSTFWVWVSFAFSAAGAFIAIRPWWLSVVLIENGFRVNSWFRKYEFREGEIKSVDITAVSSVGVGAVAVSYVPFVGSVRMIEVVRNDGRITWLPCLVGRRNNVLKLARRLRVQVGISSAFSLTDE